MKTPEEIKKGLEYCSEKAKRKTKCSECIYFNDPRGWCSTAITKDALSYIQQLEAQQPRWISVGEQLPDAKIDGDTSDGYHTFNDVPPSRSAVLSNCKNVPEAGMEVQKASRRYDVRRDVYRWNRHAAGAGDLPLRY